MSQPTTLRQRLPGVLWSAFLGAPLAVGGLSVLLRIWGPLSPGILGPAAAALAGGLLCAAAARQTARPVLAWGLRLGPWLALLLAGAGSLWQGLLLWLNSGIARWNSLHQGGAALFPTTATTGSVLLVSLAAGAALGQLSYGLVARHRTALCGVYCGVLALAALLTGTLSAVWGSLLFAAFLGVWVTRGALPARQARCLWGVAATALLACAVLTPSGELVRVTRLRQQAAQQLQTVRYGEDRLPQGALRQAASLNSDDAQALTVQAEQIKTLYLRGYVGAVYRDGVWKPLPASAYSGDYAGMLQWLARQGFDPLTQPAAYYSLCEADDRPENNRLTVSVTGASRRYLYLPASLTAVKGANTADRKDQRLTPTDLFGARTYTADELSSSRPAELTVRAAWVGQPQTEAQRAYTQAEAVYREFVYQQYTTPDAGLQPLLQQLFWQDDPAADDGIYSAITRVREVLRQTVSYTASLQPSAEDVDPIRDFLTGSRQGNSMLYASAAVQALRSCGIPARYVEGYYLSAAALENSGGEAAALTGQDAHAWAEVYFDGIGWLPVDVTPGYYFDAVTLQQMVALPDTVQKTAALVENGDNSGAPAEGGAASGGSQPTPLVVFKNTLWVLLGLLVLAVFVLTVLFALAELLRLAAERRAAQAYHRANADQKVRLQYRQLFRLLRLWGVDACLGWDAAKTDAALTACFADIQPGDYTAAAALLEKALYGGITLEPYEMRTVQALLDKVQTARPKQRRLWLRLRYSSLLPLKEAAIRAFSGGRRADAAQ